MVKKMAFGFVALLALLLAWAATRPDNFKVERSITVAAPAAKVFALLNDFHHFGRWSPWQKLDPAMVVTHSGAASGPGAIYTWTGNKEVGAGRMEILKQTPDSQVTVKLDFLEPFESHNTSEYSLNAVGNTTVVTWAMFGPSPFISKLMGIFVSMDSMIGKDFERGLANLKAVAETP